MQHDVTITLVGESIPIVAIVMGIGIAMLSVYLDFRKKRELLQAYHAERMAAIEKGIDVPPLPADLLAGPPRRESSPARQRRNGLILLLLGIAITGAMLSEHNRGAWWGMVLVAIGVALLISSRLEAAERLRVSGGADGSSGGSSGGYPGGSAQPPGPP